MLLRLVAFVLLTYMALRCARALLGLPAARPGPGPGPRPAAPPPPPPSGPRAPSPREVLGVAPGASLEEVRAAYQRLVRQYHPDQVAHMGPEVREVAERRTKEITAAWDTLRRAAPPPPQT